MQPHFRRNFSLGVANGALVNFGRAFIDPFTVLPVFVIQLGGSSVLAGLATALFSAGWFLPQFLVARWVQGRRRALPMYTAMSVLRVTALAGATCVVFFGDARGGSAMLAGVLGFLAVNTLAAGVAGLPFLEVTSKAIPVTGRGTFFGTRRLAGGALGVLAGVIVAAVLAAGQGAPAAIAEPASRIGSLLRATGLVGRTFPHDYGLLFLLATVLSAVGFAAFGFVREAPTGRVNPTVSLGRHIGQGIALLRRHRNYRRFFLVRASWQLTAMAFPFYATYAVVHLGFHEAAVGAFVSVWTGSAVLSNIVWGRLLDARGNRLVLVATAILSLGAPCAVLALEVLRHRGLVGGTGAFWVLAGAFLLNGFARSGRFISNMTYLLEYAPESERPLHVGFMNTLSFPFMLSPILGGLVADVGSFSMLFALALGFGLINIALSARLVEPRTGPRLTGSATQVT